VHGFNDLNFRDHADNVVDRFARLDPEILRPISHRTGVHGFIFANRQLTPDASDSGLKGSLHQK
jgi:hypothetical protein